MNNLTELGHAVNGSFSLSASLLATQPFFTLKTFHMTQSQRPPFRRLWAGYMPNAVAGGLAEGVTFVTYKIGSDLLKKQGEELSNYQNIALSLAAGTIGAPINASFEQGMIRQQLYGNSLSYHMKDIYKASSWKGIFKATGFTAARDGLFTCGIFAFNDYTQSLIKPIVATPFWNNLTSGMISGMVAGFFSTPFDLVKTIVQADPKIDRTCTDITKEMIKRKGIASIFKGAVHRSLTIGPLICLTSLLKDQTLDYFPEYLKTQHFE